MVSLEIGRKLFREFERLILCKWKTYRKAKNEAEDSQ